MTRRTFTLDTPVTHDQAVAILTAELDAECVHNTEAGDAHTLGDYMADVMWRFRRMLDGEYGAQEFGDPELTFTLPQPDAERAGQCGQQVLDENEGARL